MKRFVRALFTTIKGLLVLGAFFIVAFALGFYILLPRDDGATLTLAVAPANASFAELSYSARHATSASAASMPGFHPEYTTFDTYRAMCHRRDRLRESAGDDVTNRVTSQGRREPVEVDRVVFYQTIGW